MPPVEANGNIPTAYSMSGLFLITIVLRQWLRGYFI